MSSHILFIIIVNVECVTFIEKRLVKNMWWKYVVAINLVSFALFTCDKLFAKAGAYRVSESALGIISGMGGWPAGALAMIILNHKIRKRSFILKFVAASVGNIGVMMLLL